MSRIKKEIISGITYKERILVEQAIAKQSENDLHREATAVDKITVEQVWVGLGRLAIDGKDMQQIVELTVYVSANCELQGDTIASLMRK